MIVNEISKFDIKGKLHFRYIFGYSMLGSCALYVLLNLMTEHAIRLYDVIVYWDIVDSIDFSGSFFCNFPSDVSYMQII